MRFIQGHHLRLREYKAALYTEERSRKLSAAHAEGRIPSPRHGRGPDNAAWRGDGIGYAGMHDRLMRELGPARHNVCARCSAPAREWALNHDHPSVKTSGPKPFATDLEAYKPLCVSCHRSADRSGGYRA